MTVMEFAHIAQILTELMKAYNLTVCDRREGTDEDATAPCFDKMEKHV